MKVLQICSKMPYPENDGGCRAMAELSRGLTEMGVELEIAGIRTHKHPGKFSLNAPKPFDRAVTPIDADIHIRLLPLLKNLFFSPHSYNLERFMSVDTGNRCAEVVQRRVPDLIILDGFFSSPLLPYIRKVCQTPVAYRSHNLEWKLWESRAGHTKNFLKSAYFRLMSARLRKEEEAFSKQVNALLFMSEEEELFFRKTAGDTPGMLLPFTINTNANQEPKTKNSITFYHLGAMNWFPTFEGMQWFLKEVWPVFFRLRPGARFILAGKGMPKTWLKAQIPGLSVSAEVEHPEDVLSQADVLVAPVFSASGIRIKVLEALCMGKPVITHSAGIQGLITGHVEGVLTADTADEYIRVMCDLYDYPEKCRALGFDAARYASAYHSRSDRFQKLSTLFHSITGVK